MNSMKAIFTFNLKKHFVMRKCSVTFAGTFIGMWRSLVAYSSGGRGVASSNLVIPTSYNQEVSIYANLFFISIVAF